VAVISKDTRSANGKGPGKVWSPKNARKKQDREVNWVQQNQRTGGKKKKRICKKRKGKGPPKLVKSTRTAGGKNKRGSHPKR